MDWRERAELLCCQIPSRRTRERVLHISKCSIMSFDSIDLSLVRTGKSYPLRADNQLV